MSDTLDPNAQQQPWAQGLAGAVMSPTTQTLLGLAGGLAQAAMPSRMKIPLGAALGMAAQGAGSGLANSYALQKQAMDTQLQRAMMPAKMSALSGMGFGGSGTPPAPFGVPAPQGGVPGSVMTPAQAVAYGRWAMLNGQDAAAARLFGLPNEMAGGPGYQATSSGGAQPTPGGAADPTVVTRNSAAKSEGSFPFDMALKGLSIGPNGPQVAPGMIDSEADKARAIANAQGQNEIVPVPVRDPKTGLVTIQTMTKAQAAQYASSNGGSAPDPTMAALGSIPSSNLRSMALTAAMNAGLPMQALPAWISAIHNETGWNPEAPDGKGGEVGIGQVKPATGLMMNVPPSALRDPLTNLTASAKYFARQFKAANGDPAKAMAGYNTGDPNTPDAAYVHPGMERIAQWSAPPPPPGVAGEPKYNPDQTAQASAAPEIEKSVRSDAREAQNAQLRLQQVSQAIAAATKGGLPPGYFSPELAEAMAAAKSLGIDTRALGIDPAAITNQQTAREALVQISGEMLKRMFPQRVTNLDVKLYGEALPNYGIDPGSLQQVLGIAGKQAAYDLSRAKFMEEYKMSHGNSSVGWEPAFYSRNGYGPDLFGAVSGRNATAAASEAKPAPAAIGVGTIATHADGRRLRWDGTGWKPVNG